MRNIIIVDDSELFRESLVDILQSRFSDLQITELESDAEVFCTLELIQPDLIFMDVNFSSVNGLEITKHIKNLHPDQQIIILTSFNIPEYKTAAFNCGADHFLSKETAPEDIVSLVRDILYA